MRDSDPGCRQGTVPDVELAALLQAVAGGQPWRQALATLDLPVLAHKERWFADSDKARPYLDLPAVSSDCVLDVGAGSGNFSQALAGRFARVVALEHHAGWCEFMRRRFGQDGVNNVEVVHAGALPLPFDANRFDLVVVNGVLEWLPQAAPDRSPRDVHAGFLRDVRRVLRPGGYVGMAIENRLYVQNFLGYSPHGEPPYTVIMPRPLAEWYARRVTGRGYSTWIYGARGYRKLLTAAGFTSVEVRVVLPDYHSPRHLVDLRAGNAALPYLVAESPRLGGALRVLGAFGVLGHLVHSFFISARR